MAKSEEESNFGDDETGSESEITIDEYLQSLEETPTEDEIEVVRDIIEKAEGKPRGTIGYRAIARQVIVAYVSHLRGQR